MTFKQVLAPALLGVSSLVFVSCENPADKTTSATTTDKVEKSAPSGSPLGTKYVFTDASKINFVGSKVTGKHDGGFQKFTGYFRVADGKPVGDDHMVVIDMNSTWADDDKLTTHLKSSDFFDVDVYPESTFEVTKIEEQSESQYLVSGNFHLHGVEKNITFPATVAMNGEMIEIDAEFDINRQDFKIAFAGNADDLIRDEVVLRLDLEAVPEQAAEPEA